MNTEKFTISHLFPTEMGINGYIIDIQIGRMIDDLKKHLHKYNIMRSELKINVGSAIYPFAPDGILCGIVVYLVDTLQPNEIRLVYKSGYADKCYFPLRHYDMTDRALPVIDKVIFNDPATIVYWMDGTKTVVKAVNEDFDKEKGLAMAFVKKVNGNKGNYNNIFRKWCKEENND